mmetsp:Transcript_8370/g.16617  ORF Transcript_8370/g.16617 Transcript_8370/m.16617 type:complete len:86 (+) Transcript_8370:2682-2939(+)
MRCFQYFFDRCFIPPHEEPQASVSMPNSAADFIVEEVPKELPKVEVKPKRDLATSELTPDTKLLKVSKVKDRLKKLTADESFKTY